MDENTANWKKVFELLIFGINAGGINIKKIKKEGKNHEKMEATRSFCHDPYDGNGYDVICCTW